MKIIEWINRSFWTILDLTCLLFLWAMMLGLGISLAFAPGLSQDGLIVALILFGGVLALLAFFTWRYLKAASEPW